MRQFVFAFFLLSASLFGTVHAASISAENIFARIGGTTSIDQGGAIHSQARSIYSMGGGMVTYQGKRVTLMNVDPPGFKAGCSGISWHFGGFAFISLDEIRQLVEAVAQASLGIAVDLAMQTLCPQCYAVMSKLREIANQMRNAAADACRLATSFGSMIKSMLPTDLQPDKAKQECSYYDSSKGGDDSPLASQIGKGACSMLGKVSTGLEAITSNLEKYQRGDTSAKKPAADDFKMQGNSTYMALTALGYPDGFVKDLLLSVFGMSAYIEVGTSCKGVFRNITSSRSVPTGSTATPETDALADDGGEQPVVSLGSSQTGSRAPGETKAGDLAQTTATTDVSGSSKGSQLCMAPPLLTDLRQAGLFLLCGPNFTEDYSDFVPRYGIQAANSDSLGAMCGTSLSAENDKTAAQRAAYHALKTSNQKIYRCRSRSSANCMVPEETTISAYLADLRDAKYTQQKYTGVGLMVVSALYEGVKAIRERKSALPPQTVAIITGAGYPLYRVMNIAAVYPALADDLLMAYGSAIAAHYVMDTITRMTSPGGGHQEISLNGFRAAQVTPGMITDLQASIRDLNLKNEAFLTQLFERQQQKDELVNRLVKINKAMQSEVINFGLVGNASLVKALKNQVNFVGPPAPGP